MMIRMTVPVGPTRRAFESLLMRLPMQVREELKQQIESVPDPAEQEKIMLRASLKHASLASSAEFASVT